MRLRPAASAKDKSRQVRAPLPVYPFSAIIGQEEMKLALLLNVIDPRVGGVLIMGHRGTGKSTAVRALADLFPQIFRVRDCLYGCDPSDEPNLCDDCHARHVRGENLTRERAEVPVVDLPLGATEDRVCGTINIERALTEGIKAFEPGLLARAHRGFLYIDEVNLLEDHLVDLLLDVAVTGRNVVEREGISLEHPSRFVLVGSGNPEEGELRPQLLDRFGLHVEIKTAYDLDQRVQIVENRDAFERDPTRFRATHETEQERLRRKLVRARKLIHQIKIGREVLLKIAELCAQLKVDGHRGELTITRASRALAALEGRRAVTLDDVRRIALMSLRHRLRRDPLDQTPGGSRIEEAMEKLFPEATVQPEAKRTQKRDEQEGAPPDFGDDSDQGRTAGDSESNNGGLRGDRNVNAPQPAPETVDAQLNQDALSVAPQDKPGRGTKSQAARHLADSSRKVYNTRRGRYTRAVSAKSDGAKIALDATLRAALTLGKRSHDAGTHQRLSLIPNPHHLITISRSALRYKRFKQKNGALFIFAVDTSGSMALNRISQAKGLMTRLLQQSYVRRDLVALVTFRGQSADVMLTPSRSVTRAGRILDTLYVGGATPLPSALLSALHVAERAIRQGTEEIVLLLLTDGRANMPLNLDATLNRTARRELINQETAQIGAALQRAKVTTIVVDTQSRFISNGEGQALAGQLGARYVYLPLLADEAQLSALAQATSR